MSEEETDVEETTEETTETAEETKPPESKGRDAAIAAERRKARAAEKRAEELQRKLDEQARKEAEAEGRWQEIAEQERQRAEDLERKIAERKQRENVTDAAQRLRFKNPSLAHKLLTADEASDPALAEQALKRLAKQEPYLVADPPERTGAAVSGSAPQGETDPYALAGHTVIDLIEQTRSARAAG